MGARSYTLSQIERLKREAKRLKKAEGMTHIEALDELARREGFEDWRTLQQIAGPKDGRL